VAFWTIEGARCLGSDLERREPWLESCQSERIRRCCRSPRSGCGFKSRGETGSVFNTRFAAGEIDGGVVRYVERHAARESQ
jgi:hypothetical protein